ncbi:hypothetical protein Dsin_001182 [Dipteronia sinensis]|uniref:Uncharacterized protein n=1 Tax=Dipteronia sinensis TaxID=43782 RepID=A0AAE0B3D1_9ROSI|nr:hypothetical protein Dsin_001182 [Dipteronia sinensis]
MAALHHWQEGIVQKNELELTDDELMRACEMGTFKSYKRESGVRLEHKATGIIAQAVEDRSQHKNRASASFGS